MAAILKGKQCATCEYWGGNRILVQGGQAVQCSSTSDQGICLYKGASKSVAHQANQGGCPKHAKWTQMR